MNNLTKYLLVIVAVMALAGCTTSKSTVSRNVDL